MQNKKHRRTENSQVHQKDRLKLKKFAKLALILTAIFAIAVILVANLFVVKENEYRVVRQFGEIIRIVQEPGMNMKIPFIQSVTSFRKIK